MGKAPARDAQPALGCPRVSRRLILPVVKSIEPSRAPNAVVWASMLVLLAFRGLITMWKPVDSPQASFGFGPETAADPRIPARGRANRARTEPAHSNDTGDCRGGTGVAISRGSNGMRRQPTAERQRCPGGPSRSGSGDGDRDLPGRSAIPNPRRHRLDGIAASRTGAQIRKGYTMHETDGRQGRHGGRRRGKGV